jgi:alkanesulfonate monooxygenase SsuD/methylene tetrahydromethanopterin reductase-like flavin-dependent oxidoreductase (luciferase family)
MNRLSCAAGRVDPDALRRAVEAAQAAAADQGADAESDDVLPRVTFTLQRDLQKRLDKYLTDRITFMSRNQLQKLIDRGGRDRERGGSRSRQPFCGSTTRWK